MTFAVNFAVVNDWQSGFTGSISIANNGTSNLNGWTLEFEAPFEITNIWNAQIVSRQGNRYTIRNLSWNSTIGAGQTLSFGFNASPGNVTSQPSGYVLNGQPLNPPTVLPAFSIADTTVIEGDAGTTFATTEVRLSQASKEAVTVQYNTANGTATAGSDYTATSGTLTFNPGQTSQTITIPVNSDLLDEPNETFTVNLSNPTKATIADAQGVVTITDNDPVPSFRINDVTTTEGNSGTKSATFTVSLSAASGRTTTVNYATANGTATAGSDYTATTGTLTFAVGETSKTISVPIIGDTTNESNETFTLNLTNPTNATIADAQGGGTITNDDTSTTPTFSINDVTVTEGNSGTSNATFIVTRSGSTTQTSTVNFATANGTATAGSDYTAVSGTLTFAAGETSKTITVPIVGDTTNESNETFTLNLTNPTNATIADAQGVGTINNDDTPPLPTLSINDVTITEGNSGTSNATFTVTRSGSTTQSSTVNFATANGTATAGSDYTAVSGTLTFAAGQTSQTITVPIVGDTLQESSETFTVTLSSPTNATIADGQGVGTITANDAPQQGAFNYGEALQKSIIFYEAQRSGDLPSTNRIPWRGDSALRDGADVGRDLSGGYYDAGDHVKFGFPMAGAMTLLSWGAIEYRNAYQQSGQLPYMLDAIKWGTDYILKAHVTDSQGTKEFWGQVGQGDLDHAYWGPPETMTMSRPSFKIDRQNPGSDLAGEAAAALAAASIVFRPTDPNYANTLLQGARQLYDFADNYRGKYSDSIRDAATFYNSWNGYNDELVWGAAWLHRATEATGSTNTTYLQKAQQYYQQFFGNGLGNWTHSWDNKQQGAAVLLAQETGNSLYRTHAENWLNDWALGRNGVTYTSGGLAWRDQWGSLRYSATTAFIAGVYADKVTDYNGRYANFAEGQIDYILGDNPRNSSYMVGFGNNSPRNPHHRAAHGSLTGNINNPVNNLHTLYGAMVGGPASANDFDYQDNRTDYIRNEVALDYNAGLTGALARMYGEFGGQPLDSIPELTLSAAAPLATATLTI
ncbi:MAG TPA: hypothetical protein DC064_17615 [Cyanobacteria bacterium UBA9273]|nr:hypothetical protein [Cyanobacteria bacterium UBA9273]